MAAYRAFCPACHLSSAASRSLRLRPSAWAHRRQLATSASPDASSTSSSTTAIEVTDPVVLYENLCRSGRIRWDEEQVRTLVQLRRIHGTLVDYRPSMTLRYLLETSASAGARRSGGVVGSSDDAPPPMILPNFNASRDLVKALAHEDDLSNLDSPPGFLLTGSVGTGKSMLMDLFYDSLPIKKQRKHYHSFLLRLYRSVFLALEQQRVALDDEERAMQTLAQQAGGAGGYPWSRKEENKALALTKGWKSVFAGGRRADDPTLVKEYVLAKVALDMIQESTVLAFDEIQLVDIAGAGILRRVLTWYWRLGGVVIGTSNRLPSDLYQQGIQKEQFRIFLDHLQTRCPVYELRSENDWRRRERSTGTDFFSLNEEDYPAWTRTFEQERTWFTDQAAFDTTLKGIVGEQKGEAKTLTVYGRKVAVPWQVDGEVAKFAFSELCERALGPADFLTLTSNFHTIIITDIPQLKLTAKNEARRFITFLDAAYESKTRLICHAAADPEDIFFPDAADILASEDNVLAQEMIGDVLQDLEAPYRPNVSSYTSTQVQDTLASAVEEVQKGSKADQPAFKSLAIFTGQDEQFAYKRALSRIYEITSKEFVRCAKHTPIPPQDRVWEHSNAKPTHYSRAPSSGFTPPASPEPIISADDADISSTARKYPRGTKVDPSDPEIDVSELPKPKIGTPHFWGVVDSWGKKAGRWGLGVEAKKEGGKS